MSDETAGPMTFGTWAGQWVRKIRALAERGILSRSTGEVYERVIRLQLGPTLGEKLLREIRRRDLIEWANAQLAGGAKKKTFTLHVAVLKVCLRDAISEGLLETNPAEWLVSSLRLPRDPQVTRWFESREQATAFLRAAEAQGREWPALALLTYTGLRLGEALGLQWSDLDLDLHRAVIRRQVTPPGESRHRRARADTGSWTFRGCSWTCCSTSARASGRPR